MHAHPKHTVTDSMTVMSSQVFIESANQDLKNWNSMFHFTKTSVVMYVKLIIRIFECIYIFGTLTFPGSSSSK